MRVCIRYIYIYIYIYILVYYSDYIKAINGENSAYIYVYIYIYIYIYISLTKIVTKNYNLCGLVLSTTQCTTQVVIGWHIISYKLGHRAYIHRVFSPPPTPILISPCLVEKTSHADI